MDTFELPNFTCDGKTEKLCIVDTAGVEELKILRDEAILSTQGILLVFSLTDRDSFAKLRAIHADVLQQRDDEDIPMVLVGNKSDLNREVEEEEVKAMAEEFGCHYFLASAKSNENVVECFTQLVREVRAKYRPPPQRVTQHDWRRVGRNSKSRKPIKEKTSPLP